MKLNPLKAEYARYGSFDVLAENNQKQLQELVVNLSKKSYANGTVEQKVGDLYKIGMDTMKIEKQGAEPIQNDLRKIASIQRSGLTAALADMALEGQFPFFALFGSSDPDNSAMTIAHFWQTGLGIGDRDFYLDADQQKIRDEYVKLLSKMFRISGYSRLAGCEGQEMVLAKKVLALETAMANFFVDKTVLRDPYQTIHKMTPAEFQKMLPAVNVNEYLQKLNLKLDTVNVAQPT